MDAVKSAVAGKGGRVMRESIEKQDDLGKFKVISVSVEVFMPDPTGINEIIYNIETRLPYMVIKEIDLRVQSFVAPRELNYKLNVSALNGAS
jgi:hypothetical protein